MLQVKSFKVTDGEGISEFLRTHLPHKSASVYVSEGNILFPFEDGELPSKERRLAGLQEDRNMVLEQSEVIEHSQRVMEIELIGINKQIEEQEGIISKKYHSKDKGDREDKQKSMNELARLKNIKNQKENQITLNQAELTNKATNVAVFNETIAKLNGDGGTDGK